MAGYMRTEKGDSMQSSNAARQVSDKGAPSPPEPDVAGIDISVVVCTRNSESTLKECLHSVRANGPRQLIIIDGKSTDDTLEIAREFTHEVYSDEGRGIASARQLGAEKATGRYVAYVDSDVVVPAGCLNTMIAELEQSGYAAIHAQVVAPDDSGSYWEWAEDQHFKAAFNKIGERKTLGAIAVLYRRDVLLEHRFDPCFSFFGAPEDGDLSFRLSEAGYKLGVSSAVVYHRHRATLWAFLRQRFAYGRGNALFLWKHRSWRHLVGPFLMVPFGLSMCLRKRSFGTLPYYVVWSLAASAGLVLEFARMALVGTVGHRPDQQE